jgi:hypothetical protein
MNEMFAPTIFRPFRAGHRMDVFLGLKPQAESYCPFAADTECICAHLHLQRHHFFYFDGIP